MIHSEDFIQLHKTAPHHFTRIRSLPFPTVILFLVNFLKRSLQPELDSFFQAAQGVAAPVREVTKAAFSQARLKLNHSAFLELNHKLILFFEDHFPSKTWHGFRLLAIDGTTLRLPNTPEMAEHFGTQPDTTSACRPMARVSQLYDVLNRITLHAVVNPYRVDERDLAIEHGSFLQKNDFVLLDRGYPAFWFFAWLHSTPAQFCARVSVDSWSEVKQFYHSGKSEQIVTITPTGDARKKCLEYGLPITPIRVRLIRVSLAGAEDQILMTSLLDTEAYPLEWLQEVYHSRWGIEENYKHMKSRIEMGNFSGKSVESVYQDFHAKVFSMNLAAVLVHPVQDQVEQDSNGSQYPYQVNMTFAVSSLKQVIVKLLSQARPLRLVGKMQKLFAKTLEPVRPGRSYPRKKIMRIRPVFFPCYKSTA